MSGFYIGVDGKARKVKGGYIGIDGKARKLKKGYIGDENGVARLCWSAFDGDPVFANNTWEKIVEACQSGCVPDTWAVGDQKTLSIGTSNYTIDIIGKNHDEYSDGSGKAPLTFQFHDMPVSGMKMNDPSSSVGGWAASNLRNVQLPVFFGTLPAVVRDAIREVNKYSGGGYQSTEVTLTQDKLFFPSGIELTGVVHADETAGEGKQYEYYAVDGTRRMKKPYQSSSKAVWWTRSAVTNRDAYFQGVSPDDGELVFYSAGRANNIAPAFCF